MKGIVFNLLEEAVRREKGADTWDDLLDEADVPGTYTSLGNYSDAEILAIVEAVAHRFGMGVSEVLRWFGERAMPILKEHYPALFDCHSSARGFVLSVNSMIHPEVRKLYPGARCPFFHFREGEGGSTIIAYESPRQMCDLAHGFMSGAAALYGEKIGITHHSCMNRGADKCLMEIQWAQ